MDMTSAGAHPSFKRLLQAAKLADAGRGALATLGRDLQVSGQTITNWVKRGLSRDGALAAERVYGVSAAWLLDTQTSQSASPAPAQRHNAQEQPSTYTSARMECHRIIDELPVGETERALLVLRLVQEAGLAKGAAQGYSAAAAQKPKEPT